MDPELCDQCFRQALTRIAILLNRAQLPALAAALHESDSFIERHAIDSALYPHLFHFTRAHKDERLAYSEYASFFYGMTKALAPQAGTGIRSVVHDARPAFTQLFRQGHQHPNYTDAELGWTPSTSVDPWQKTLTLGTNYLVKNLWHNLVHVSRQGINEGNFGQFAGRAREASDFTADNLGAILHALSYGLNVTANGLGPSLIVDNDFIFLQRRNRSNKMFFLREKIRSETTEEVRLSQEEAEWRYRRSVAVYLSGWLIACGRAACSLSVEFGRKMREGNALLIEVNGHYLLVEEESQHHLVDTQPASRDHLRKIAMTVDQKYRHILERQPGFADYATGILNNELTAIGLDRLEI